MGNIILKGYFNNNLFFRSKVEGLRLKNVMHLSKKISINVDKFPLINEINSITQIHNFGNLAYGFAFLLLFIYIYININKTAYSA